MDDILASTSSPFDLNVGAGLTGTDGYGLSGALENRQLLATPLSRSRATNLTNLEIQNLLAEPTIVAIAQGNSNPPTARYPNTVTNGDFLLGGNSIATLVGDGLDDFTTWTFDLTRDADFTDLTDTSLLASAELTLTLKTNFGIETDGITIQGLGSIVKPIRELTAGETHTITIDLLDYFSPDTVLRAIQNNAGKLTTTYQDDAIVSFAQLKLSTFDSGIFTVGDTGQVSVNFLADGGAYEGELAIFSLASMGQYKPGSNEFIKEAARRALTNSILGHVAISDQAEGARFTGILGAYEGQDWNTGEYSGNKTFSMNPGDRFGFMLVPNGWTQEVFTKPGIGGSKRPLFSMSTTDPDDALDGKQFAWVVSTATNNNSFAFEDLLLKGVSDRDYNDVLFQVRGATGKAQAIDGIIAPEKDWRSNSLGAAIIARLELEKTLGLIDNPVDVGNGVWFLGAGIHPDDLRIVRPNNINAADTTNTDQLWVGGELGLNLDGNGLTVGVWEAGEIWRIRDTHEKLNGRVTLVDAGTGFSDHATHVAGTIGAAIGGTGNNAAQARGMATQVTLRSYSDVNDVYEMDNDAALMVASNHSYSFSQGWWFGEQNNTRDVDGNLIGLAANTNVWLSDYSFSSVEDPDFGKYDSTAQAIDSVLDKHPHLLSIWGASNDRNNNIDLNTTRYVTFFNSDPEINGLNWVASGWYLVPTNVVSPPQSDGNGGTGYDSLPNQQVAKNTLVVGAIRDINATMTDFSSWGPTDDGRVKPDVVADGEDLWSSGAASDNAYYSSSGTSMAAPNVTGTAVLLIQHYQNLFGSLPRSATTKGLLIHTATDAGNIGPDYQFGWGVVDAARAATFLTNAQDPNSPSFLRERAYAGTEQIIAVQSNGVEPLKVTITWTDPPPDTPQAAGLDVRTPVLVNDLDIRVIGPDGTIYYPWTLDPANPGTPAGQGINSVDNVEQVLFTPPTAGTYQIRISHKGSTPINLVNPQAYSLLTSGARFLGDIFEGVYEGGQGWGSGLINPRGVTSISSGDVNGDGNDEIAVGRNSGDNARFYLLDFDSGNSFTDLLGDQGGSNWGDSRGVTSLSFGDVDGDGNDELAVGRNNGDNTRFYLFDYVNGGLVDLLGDQGGRGWGDSRGVTSLSFGDVDGDGNNELAVGRNSGDNTRFYLFDYANGGLVDLLGDQGGRGWGDSRGVTSLSFGDVDGDGNAELAVGRNDGDNTRFYLFDYVNGGLVDLLGDQGGRNWGDSRGVTSLAFGDVDGDGNDELAVGRNSGDNTRFYLFDYANGGLVDLLGDQGGSNWGDSRGVTSLSFGDVDGDGNDELAVGRNSGDNTRFYLFDYANGGLVDLLVDQGGRSWGDSRGVTSLSFGDVDGDGNDELAVGRDPGDNARYFIFGSPQSITS